MKSRVESEVSRVQLSHDPRSQHDDPLLDSLLSLCVLHQKPASRVMLTTGLPLPAQRLSPELLPRAAARAGLQGRLLQRKLEHQQSLLYLESLPSIDGPTRRQLHLCGRRDR